MDALARMARSACVPLLVQALSGEDAEAQVRAAQTLGLVRDAGDGAGPRRRRRDRRETVRRGGRAGPRRDPGPGGAGRAPRGARRREHLVRQQAVLALGKLREPESAPLLLPAARRTPTRACASRPCARSGRSATPTPCRACCPFLGDARKELRFAAVEALGQIRAPAAVRPLVDALRDPDRNLRRAAAEGLGEIGDPQAVAALLLALEDEHWSVRCAAATALGRLGSPKATGALLGASRRRRRDGAPRRGVGPRRDRRRARGRPARRRARRSRAAVDRRRGPAAARRRPRCPRSSGPSARAAPTRRCAGCSSTSPASSRTPASRRLLLTGTRRPRAPTCARRPPWRSATAASSRRSGP